MDAVGNIDGKRAAFRAAAALLILAFLAGALFWLQPDQLYLWIKALHVISVIAWMAGMLYLPRLLVYHADATAGSDISELFKVMESRLLRVIINPAMMFAWVFGLWLAWSGYKFSGGWLHLKLAAVLALSAFHGYLSKAVREFAADANKKSARHWRLMNEVPTLLMIIIVILVILKPF